jgi:hypothetical protein
MLTTVAQSARVQANSVQILFWLAVIVAAAMVLIVVGVLLRKWFLREPEDAGPRLGFGLSDLRQMHAAGELSDEEFARAKAALIARSRGALGLESEETDADQSPAPQRDEGP